MKPIKKFFTYRVNFSIINIEARGSKQLASADGSRGSSGEPNHSLTYRSGTAMNRKSSEPIDQRRKPHRLR